MEKMYREHVLEETEFRIIRPDGKQRHLKQRGKVFITDASDLTMVGIVQDITVQKGLEKKIAELTEKTALQDIIKALTEDASETSSIIWHPDGHMLWSDSFFRLLGYKPDAIESSSKTFYRQIHPHDLKRFKEAEVLATNGQPQNDVFFRITNKGGTKQVKINFNRVTTGPAQLVVGLVKDITKESLLHNKLSETVRYAEAVSSTTTNIILLTDRENMILSWNAAAADKTTIKAEDALYSNLFDIFPELNEETYLKKLQLVLEGTEVKELKARHAYLKKAHHYYLAPLKNESGEVTQVLHVVQDVSRELELQQQLSERLAFIESMVESSVDRIVVLDKHMNYIYWNKKAEEYYAISKQRVLGRNILEVFPRFRNDPNYAEFRKVLKGETVYIPAAHIAGSKDYFETYLIPVKDEKEEVTAILWIVHDLSELKTAEEQIRDKSHYLQRITETVPDMISVTELATMKFDYLNRETFLAHGFDPDRMNKTSEERSETIHPADRENLGAYFKNFVSASDDDIITAEYRAKDNTGEWKWFLVRGRVFQRNGAGEVTHVLNVIENITERKKAEQEILQLKDEIAQKATDKYLNLFNSIDTGFCIIEVLFDKNGKPDDYRFLETNPAFIKQTGLKNAIGKTIKEFAPLHEEFWFEIYGEIARTGESKRFEHYASQIYEGVWYDVSAFRVDASGQNHVAILFNIVTERKNRELSVVLLDQLSKALATLTHPDEIIQTVGARVGEFMQVATCVFQNVDEERNEVTVHFAWSLEGLPDLKRTYSLSDYVSEEFIATNRAGQAFIVNDVNTDARTDTGAFDKLKIGAFVTVPFHWEGRWAGYISVTDVRPRVWLESEIELLREVANRLFFRIERARAEEALRISEEKYRTIFKTIDEGFTIQEVVTDENDNVIDIIYRETNDAFAHHTGITDVVGKKASEFVPHLEERWLNAMTHVYRTGEPLRMEGYQADLKRWITLHYSRVDGPGSKFISVVFNDITEQKQQEQHQVFLLTFSDTLREQPNPDAIANKALQMLLEQLQLDRCYVGIYKMEEDRAEFPYQIGNDKVPPLPPDGVRLSDFPDALKIATDRTLVINDLRKTEGLTDRDKQNLGALGFCGLVVATVRKGANKPLWAINAVLATPRQWTPAETKLIEEVAERTWAAIERAKAEEAFRRSSASLENQLAEGTSELIHQKDVLQSVFDASPQGIILFNVIRNEKGMIEDYEVVLNNAKTQQWNGRDLKGKLYSKEFPAIKTHGIFDAFNKVMETGEPSKFEVKYQGEGFKNWFIITAIRLNQHELLSTAEDITERKNAEEKIRKNFAILQQTEELAQIGSWEYEIASGNFTWSEGMYRIFGLSMEQKLKPEIYLEYAVEEDKRKAKSIIQKIKKENSSFEEIICINRGECVRELRIKAVVVHDENGAPQKILGVDLDVTDLKEAEHEALVQTRFAQTIVDASIDQLTIFDKDQRFLVWNKKAEEAAGLKKEDVIGKTIDEIFPGIAGDPEFIEAQQKALAGEYVYIPAKRGLYSKNYQQWFYVPLKNEKGEVYAVLNIVHDITDKVEAQELLLQKNKELESKNDEITNFAFIAAHDLKEPLRKIHTFSNWLLEKEANALSIEGKEFVFKLSKAVKRLDLLIQDITTLTRIEALKENHEEVDLNGVLTIAMDILDPKIRETNAIIKATGLPIIMAHRQQMVYLFKNIISNAIKFQQRDVKPVIEIKVEQVTNPAGLKPGSYFKIYFTDNGIGFDEKFATKIFRVFQRLHGQAEYPGTGIGLAICKKIMENHGGFIIAESKLNKGSVFSCYFPYNA